MKNLQCDICSKQVQYEFQLHNLKEVYQTENIAQICGDCSSVVNKQLYKLQNKCWNGNLPAGDISKELEKCIVSLKVLDGGFKAEGFWSKVWKGVGKRFRKEEY